MNKKKTRAIFQLLFGLLAAVIMALPASAGFPLITNFIGGKELLTTYNGEPVPVGSIVEAHFPEETKQAYCTVYIKGKYGFLAVDNYGAGEILEDGDVMIFYINRRPATPLGPDEPTWEASPFSLKEVNLEAVADMGIAMEVPASDMTASPGDKVVFSVTVRNTGTGLDFYRITSLVSSHDWIVEPLDEEFVYAEPGETATLQFELWVPPGASEGTDQIEYAVTSAIDGDYEVSATVLALVSITDIGDDSGEVLPDDFRLYQNYPNPFNPATTIAFDLPSAANVVLTVYDILGRVVHENALGILNAGYHTYEFDAGSLSSGVYFYRLDIGESSRVRRMILMK